MLMQHTSGSAVVMGNKIWVAGNGLETEIFEDGTWKLGPDMPSSCIDHKLIQISNDEVGHCYSGIELFSSLFLLGFYNTGVRGMWWSWYIFLCNRHMAKY